MFFAENETVTSALEKATRILDSSLSARLDAEILLSFVLKRDRVWLITNHNFCLDKKILKTYEKLIARRAKYEPVAYITGKKEFMGLNFYVDRNVLIPRPETEILVETAIDIIKEEPIKSILEIGTGSGALICSVAYYSDAKFDMEALDISAKAIEVAKKNARQIGIEKRIKFFKADIFDFDPGKRYDMILVNPPYVKNSEIKNELLHEPFQALSGGANGMEFISLLLPKLSMLCKKVCLMEIGKNQDREVAGNAFFQTEFIKDLAGVNRVMLLKKSE